MGPVLGRLGLGCMGGGMNYLSVCSGIEAATQAFHPIGWQPVAFTTTDPDSLTYLGRAVLAELDAAK